METGQQATLEFTVTEEDTAVSVGSGDLRVLATPQLLAWCEAAACAAIDGSLTEQQTSVSSRISFEHIGASPVGARVSATATVTYVDGRLVRFEVVASNTRVHGGVDDAEERVIGHGEATRVVVDRERFLARLVERPGG